MTASNLPPRPVDQPICVKCKKPFDLLQAIITQRAQMPYDAFGAPPVPQVCAACQAA